jgi:histone deacetylase 1/2
MLWRGLTLPNLSGAHLHGFLDNSVPASDKTVTEGTGDGARTVPNPEYARWWALDQKVLGLLLSSMEEDIATQLIGCKTAAATWAAVHTMFGAQNRANVRHIRRQLQATRKGDMSAAVYMHTMKSFADAMATAGAPITDDELVDYIITGLGTGYNSIAGALTVGNVSVSYADFYSHVLSFEALQAQQAETMEWSSSANAASRPGGFGGGSGAPWPRAPASLSGGPSAGSYPTGYGGGNGGRPTAGHGGGQYGTGGGTYGAGGGGYGQPYGQPASGGNSRPNYGGNGGGNRQNGGNGRRRQRPQCQICGYWGHAASECRNRFNPEFVRANNSNNNQQRSGNSASTGSPVFPPWIMDTGATDHLTNDLQRLHMQERYGGTDQVQVANGAGLSIAHIGHSSLAGSPLKLNNILHVPNISQHLLSVYRLVCDNDVFVEFHRHFFCVKDKATRRILLHGRSHGGLYPIPFSRASSSSRHALSGAKTTSSQWHQRLGHPTNNVVQTIVKNHDLSCVSVDTSSICDACQRAKSHQLSYNLSHRVTTAPLELVHSDVWGPAVASSGGFKYYVIFIDDYSRFCWI